LRGLLFFSDGADNGTRYPTMDKAALWRGTAPLHTFALGRPTTSTKQRDVAFVDINAEPSPVPVKGKLVVTGKVNAPGFENSTVDVRLEIDGKPVPSAPVQRMILKKTLGNDVQMACDAPATPGDIKVTLKIDPLPGEVTPLNNEISTFVPVTKEGVSILWVEGKKRAFESVFAIRALNRDPRFRIY